MTDLNERQTRAQLIDPALGEAGWPVDDPDRVGIEIPVDGFDPARWRAFLYARRGGPGGAAVADARVGYEAGAEHPIGICDYCLYRPNGQILAVVEAKRERIDPRNADLQAEFYVGEIKERQGLRPFAFLCNGHDTYFYDVGRAAPRWVSGVFGPEALENLLYLRENGLPLAGMFPDPAIADRAYQLEAIRRVCEAFDGGRRKALLVMATGTGKTRTAMSLIDVMLRANQARKVLFVADRDALVQQALDDGLGRFFQEPSMRLYSDDVDPTKRLFAVTLQTLNNIYRRFDPAFFDLIVYDEVHRSIFHKWREPMYYFDARMVGLTATPAEMVDRNTFLAFGCSDGVPTFNYAYRQAVQEGYLVDFTLYAAETGFQRRGIHGADLADDQIAALVEQGIDPDALDYEGRDLEVRVSNRDTLRLQWREVMERCYRDPSGLPGKTIVFALSQRHAQRLQEVFLELYPDYYDQVRVITYRTKYARRAIDQFKKQSKPRIAISVDMLETGVDVPECVNLVFMRPVHSAIKLQQMVGRGTRPMAACAHPEWLPDGRKDDFLILDLWQNDLNKPPDEVQAQSLPVLVSLFNARLELLERRLDDPGSEDAGRVVEALRAQIARIPTAAYAVRQAWPAVRDAWEDPFWEVLTPARVAFLHDHVGPLLRDVPDVDVAAEGFALRVCRLELARERGSEAAGLLRAVRDDAYRVPPNLLGADPDAAAARDLCLDPHALLDAEPAALAGVVEALGPWMKKRQKDPVLPLEIDLPDELALSGYVILEGMPEPVYAEEYRARVEEAVLGLAEAHPTVQAIARGERVSDAQILDLERTLRERLGRGELHLNEHNIRAAYRGRRVGSLVEFLRDLLELRGIPDYQTVVQRAFGGYIAAHPFDADQTRFLRAVQSVFLQKRRLRLPDLYAPPLTAFGQDAAERYFSADQLDDLLAFAQTLTVTGE